MWYILAGRGTKALLFDTRAERRGALKLNLLIIEIRRWGGWRGRCWFWGEGAWGWDMMKWQTKQKQAEMIFRWVHPSPVRVVFGVELLASISGIIGNIYGPYRVLLGSKYISCLVYIYVKCMGWTLPQLMASLNLQLMMVEITQVGVVRRWSFSFGFGWDIRIHIMKWQTSQNTPEEIPDDCTLHKWESGYWHQ